MATGADAAALRRLERARMQIDCAALTLRRAAELLESNPHAFAIGEASAAGTTHAAADAPQPFSAHEWSRIANIRQIVREFVKSEEAARLAVRRRDLRSAEILPIV